MFLIVIDDPAIALTCGFGLAFAVSLLEGIMLRWFLVAACAAGLVAAPFALGVPEANAHGRNYSPLCVVVQWSRAWLHFDYDRCDDCCCQRPGGIWVYWGRAFRAGSQQGELVRVWNLQTNGRINYRSLRLAHEKYCAAAGI